MKIHELKKLPHDIQTLVSESQFEGYHFLKRLVDEFNNATNLFNQQGEILLSVRDNDALVAIGGINSRDGVARLRRFYVSKGYRRSGVGRQLLEQLESHAALSFSEIVLFTDTPKASRFYEACGYVAMNEDNVSHRKVFTQDKKALSNRIHEAVMAVGGPINLDLPARSMPRAAPDFSNQDS